MEIEIIRGIVAFVCFDLDNSFKTLLNCLQMAGVITDDKRCFQIERGKENRQVSPESRICNIGSERAETAIQ